MTSFLWKDCKYSNLPWKRPFSFLLALISRQFNRVSMKHLGRKFPQVCPKGDKNEAFVRLDIFPHFSFQGQNIWCFCGPNQLARRVQWRGCFSRLISRISTSLKLFTFDDCVPRFARVCPKDCAREKSGEGRKSFSNVWRQFWLGCQEYLWFLRLNTTDSQKRSSSSEHNWKKSTIYFACSSIFFEDGERLIELICKCQKRKRSSQMWCGHHQRVTTGLVTGEACNHFTAQNLNSSVGETNRQQIGLSPRTSKFFIKLLPYLLATSLCAWMLCWVMWVSPLCDIEVVACVLSWAACPDECNFSLLYVHMLNVLRR